jgi:putative transposase
MARRRRIQIPGLIHHVMSRGNGRMQIFLDSADYRHFVYLLGEVAEELDVECLNYCVMPNHYHATLQPTLANLSEALRQLNGRYAQWWNKKHSRVGHVFQGRFKDQIVQQDGYFLTLCRYVALNPVRSGLVERPEDWEWSSYAATVGVYPTPSFLAVDTVLRQFGEEPLSTLQARFAAHVLGPSGAHIALEDRIRSNEQVLGDADFKRELVESGERSGDIVESIAEAS